MAATALRGEQGHEYRLHVPLAGDRTQLPQGTLGENAPGVHRHQGVEAFRLFHVGGGHQNAQVRAAPAQPLHQLPEAAPGERVHPRGRLVQDEQVGVVDQGAAEPQLLLHAAGEVHRQALDEGGKAGGSGEFGDALGPCHPVLPEEAAEKIQVLPYREAGIEVAPKTLGHVGDALDHGIAPPALPQIPPQDFDLAGLDAAHPGDEAEQGGLADPVRADQSAQPPGG